MHNLEYVIVKLLFVLFSLLSIANAERAALFITFIVRRIFRYRERVIRDNLNRVYGKNWPLPEKKAPELTPRSFTPDK